MTYSAEKTYLSAANPLCDKLKRKFAGRGVAAAARRSEQSAAVIARVRSSLNPYEGETRTMPQSHPQSCAPVRSQQCKKVLSERCPNSRRMVSGGPVPPSSATGFARASKKTAVRSVPQNSAVKKTQVPVALACRTAVSTVGKLFAPDASTADEVRVTKKSFPFAAVTILTILTIMTMVMLFSFAQNYELQSEITLLKKDIQTMSQTEKDLSIQLEQRDDIRTIEDIAVNRIGMVKANLVASRFVSASGGDRIQLNTEALQQEETAENHGFFSTMLSAIGENLNKLREHID